MNQLKEKRAQRAWLKLLDVAISLAWFWAVKYLDVDEDGRFIVGLLLFAISATVLSSLSDIVGELESISNVLHLIAQPQLDKADKDAREGYVKSASAHQDFVDKLSKISSGDKTNWECPRCGIKMNQSHSTCTNCGTRRI